MNTARDFRKKIRGNISYTMNNVSERILALKPIAISNRKR